MPWFYLSFADPQRPTGSQWLGGAYIEAPTDIEAVQEAWKNEINPGGEVMIWEVPEKIKIPISARWRLIRTQKELSELIGPIVNMEGKRWDPGSSKNESIA